MVVVRDGDDAEALEGSYSSYCYEQGSCNVEITDAGRTLYSACSLVPELTPCISDAECCADGDCDPNG